MQGIWNFVVMTDGTEAVENHKILKIYFAKFRKILKI